MEYAHIVLKGEKMEYQISMFDTEPLNRFQTVLTYGSGFASGKIRIYAAAINFNTAELASYLKEEYGVGGRSIDGGFADYDSKGIMIRMWNSEEKEIYSWSECAKEIKHLISMDRYLDNKDKEIINEIQRKHNSLPIPIPRYSY